MSEDMTNSAMASAGESVSPTAPSATATSEVSSPISSPAEAGPVTQAASVETYNDEEDVVALRNRSRVPGRPLALFTPRPWHEPVEGNELLLELYDHFCRHVVMETEAAVAAALWVVFTHAIDYAPFSPRLLITSPEKRCGKTTLLAVISELVPRSLDTSNVSPAVLYRAIELARPTVLIDEADSFVTTAEDLRGIVNSGHARKHAFVLRCAGDKYEPRRFSTWAAMVIAAIGKLPSTIEDRSIIIGLRRRAKTDAVTLLSPAFDELLRQTRQRCVRWVQDHRDALRAAMPAIPDELNDRAANNWSLLFAIADLAGGNWPTAARKAAVKLSGRADESDDSEKIELLRDVREIFAAQKLNQLPSSFLTQSLASKETSRWADLGGRGKSLTPIQMARMLRQFGIKPLSIWAGGTCVKGYRKADFEDAFARYLPTH